MGKKLCQHKKILEQIRNIRQRAHLFPSSNKRIAYHSWFLSIFADSARQLLDHYQDPFLTKYLSSPCFHQNPNTILFWMMLFWQLHAGRQDWTQLHLEILQVDTLTIGSIHVEEWQWFGLFLSVYRAGMIESKINQMWDKEHQNHSQGLLQQAQKFGYNWKQHSWH